MDTFIQLTLNGLTLGSVYALIALGYSLVYGILKLLNFAHGDVLMVGAFIGWGVLGRFGGSLDPSIPVALLIALMLLVAMLGCGVLSELESRVLSLYLDGYSYTVIGEKLDCDCKTVDNALQRVKRKVGAHLRSRDVLL